LIKRIHVNQHVIKANRSTGAKDPVLTVKTYKNNYKVNRVEIMGSSVLACKPDSPLSCGAVLWIETDAPVRLDDSAVIW
jgi:hypothetical protein